MFNAFKIAILFTGLFFAASIASAAQIKVVTTIGQLTDITKNIGGEYVKVVGLMGAGVDPHLYKASAGDVAKLSSADIIIYNGIHLEAKMGEVFEKMKGKKMLAVGEFIPEDLLLSSETFAGQHDPHIWFDVTLWTRAAEAVTKTLVEFDPAHADQYNQNSIKYIEELKALHQYVQAKAAELPENQRVLVTAHDAFRYFGRAYGFEVLGLQGISTETEAGAKDVMKLADFIAERKIKAIFVESSVPERNIRAVRDAVKSRGWDVVIGGSLFSDAMGDAGTPQGTYEGMVKYNIDTIVGALK